MIANHIAPTMGINKSQIFFAFVARPAVVVYSSTTLLEASRSVICGNFCFSAFV